MNHFPYGAHIVKGAANADTDRLKVYSAELPSEVVAEFYVEPAGAVEGGFQRRLDMKRAEAIGRLMGGDREKDIDPEPNMHGGILAYAEPHEVEIHGQKLEILRPLRIIDGQHRAAGAAWAQEHGKQPHWTESVRIVVGADRAELAMWYIRANVEARKVRPDNVIRNAAVMTGVDFGRKSWVARHAVKLSATMPFVLENETSLVNFGDGWGRITAQSLYRAIDEILPDELNQEGAVEKDAFEYLKNAFAFYASLFPTWGRTDANGRAVPSDAYTFTMMTAFGKLWAKAEGDENKVRAAFVKANLNWGLPKNVGSGERAASAIASYAAGAAGLGP